jgi:hypothetical protein
MTYLLHQQRILRSAYTAIQKSLPLKRQQSDLVAPIFVKMSWKIGK